MSVCHNTDIFFAQKCQKIILSSQKPFGIKHANWLYRNFKKNHTMSVNVKPLSDRVLIEPAAAEEKTAGGIIIPDTAKEKPQRGVVVAVGNGTKDEPMTVKAGDTVLYGKYSGTELNIEGKDYLIMKESDIYAIV